MLPVCCCVKEERPYQIPKSSAPYMRRDVFEILVRGDDTTFCAPWRSHPLIFVSGSPCSKINVNLNSLSRHLSTPPCIIQNAFVLWPCLQTNTDEQALLVGILGEDRLTCTDEEMRGVSTKGCRRSIFFLALAVPLLVTMCVTLLTDEAAQVMATWTFDGTNYRVGAGIGLVLCLSIPTILYAYIRHRKVALVRLLERCPPADETCNSLSQS